MLSITKLKINNNNIFLLFIIFKIYFQSELFQDDLFPPTKVTWDATMTANEWLNNKDKKVRKISLKPDGMESCKFKFEFLSTVCPSFPKNNKKLTFCKSIKVSSTQQSQQSQPQQQEHTPTKKTDHAPTSNILQSYNRQLNAENEKYKQAEVICLIFNFLKNLYLSDIVAVQQVQNIFSFV